MDIRRQEAMESRLRRGARTLALALLVALVAALVGIDAKHDVAARRLLLDRAVEHLNMAASLLAFGAQWEYDQPNRARALTRIQNDLSLPLAWGGPLGCICDPAGTVLAVSPPLPLRRGQQVGDILVHRLGVHEPAARLSSVLNETHRIVYVTEPLANGRRFLMLTGPAQSTGWVSLTLRDYDSFEAELPVPLSYVELAIVAVTVLLALGLMRAHGAARVTGPADLDLSGYGCPGAVLAVSTPEGRIIGINEEGATLLGAPKPDLNDTALEVHCPEWAQPRVQRLLARSCADGKAFEHELPVQRADGAIVWVDATAQCLDPESPDVILCLYHDITERRIMQEEILRAYRELEERNTELEGNNRRLEESETLYRALFVSSLDGVMLIDPESHRVFAANPQAGTILGCDAQTLVGVAPERFFPHDDLATLQRAIEQISSGEPLHVTGLTWRRPDGSLAHIDASATEVTYGDKRVVQAVFRDVTGRVNMERALADTNQQLRKTAETKSKFLAMTSHEIRTPLNAIIGFSELLEDTSYGDLGDTQLEFARNIKEAGQDLMALIGDVLDLSKVEAGRMRIELEPVAIFSIIESSRRIVRGMARDTEVDIQVSVEPEDIVVAADTQRIKQVLYNLLSNAIRYSPHGGEVLVQARVVEGMAAISVIDDGPGIPPEDQERIFEAYFRIPTEGEDLNAGTGLGLPLSRGLVEMHHGTLTVNSTPGEGATFTFTLPLALRPDDA